MTPISPLGLVFFTGLAVLKTPTKKQKCGTHLCPIQDRPQPTCALIIMQHEEQDFRNETLGAKDPVSPQTTNLGSSYHSSSSLVPGTGCLYMRVVVLNLEVF